MDVRSQVFRFAIQFIGENRFQVVQPIEVFPINDHEFVYRVNMIAHHFHEPIL